jgi:hypothetical protein
MVVALHDALNHFFPRRIGAGQDGAEHLHRGSLRRSSPETSKVKPHFRT